MERAHTYTSPTHIHKSQVRNANSYNNLTIPHVMMCHVVAIPVVALWVDVVADCRCETVAVARALAHARLHDKGEVRTVTHEAG